MSPILLPTAGISTFRTSTTMKGFLRTVGAACMLSHGANAIQLTLGDETSVKSAASTIAYGLMKYYTGNNTGDVPGNLPDPYFCK